MDVVLQQINKIQGVAGSFVCDEDGKLLGHALPPNYAFNSVQETASLLAENIIGMNDVTGGVCWLDMRFSGCRIVVRPMLNCYLLLLCEPKINFQLLTMSLAVAQKKIEKDLQLFKTQAACNPLKPEIAAPALPVVCEPRMDGEGLIFVVDSITASSKIQWDQMKEEVSISSLQVRYLRKISINSPARKLKLTNKSTKKSKIFAVRISEARPGQLADDKIALTLAAAEALEAKPGDEITVEAATGGIFKTDFVLLVCRTCRQFYLVMMGR